MSIERYIFGDEVVPYIRSQLGALTLSRFLHDLPLEGGRVHAYLPPELLPERILNYKASIQIPTGIMFEPEADRQAERDILAALRAPGHHCALFETGQWPDNKQRSGWTFPYLIHNDDHDGDVYSYVDSDDATTEAIEEAMGWALCYPFVGAVIQLPPELAAPAPNSIISEDLLRAFAASATMLAIGAYDDETKLIWTPT